MPRKPALTYRGALAILGKSERRWLKRLDGLLGGVILLAPATHLLGAAAALSAIFGWVDQKNELINLTGRLIDQVRKNIYGLNVFERQELILAAHTTIAVGAFFESLEEYIGRHDSRLLDLTREQKLELATRRLANSDSYIENLYLADIPAPSVARGFYENLEQIRRCYSAMSLVVSSILRDLGEPPDDSIGEAVGGSELPDFGSFEIEWSDAYLVELAMRRYQSHYVKLSADVPEFFVWSIFGEHAATRVRFESVEDRIEQAESRIALLLQRNIGSLIKMQELLSFAIPSDHVQPVAGIRESLYQANWMALEEPIIPREASTGADFVLSPTIDEIYQNPRYQHATYGSGSSPAEDRWWSVHGVYADLDVFLAGFFMSLESTELPLVLLGYPGSGKSLLTKVMAARLPVEQFTVVRVPLRDVDADAPVYLQIEQALGRATHGRVTWPELAQQSAGTIRVIMLDGFDELLQATATSRSSYLEDVAQFQRGEAAQGRPVAVVVTSRTVVAERARIQHGTVLVRLAEFDNGQIETWLRAWNDINETRIRDGLVRGLQVDVALRHEALAREPLLLLMLALYESDPGAPALEADLSAGTLYARLLHNFVRREELKHGENLSEDELGSAVSRRLAYLGVAAFSMFNRGRQDATDDELGMDIWSLLEGSGTTLPPPANALRSLGQRVIGQFFFVYKSEATETALAEVRRAYEFLHATFGEYLVAYYASDVFLRTVQSGQRDIRGLFVVDDEELFTLLSHQPLAGRVSISDFLGERLREMPAGMIEKAIFSIEAMMLRYRLPATRNRFPDYRPQALDYVRSTATFASNLLLIRLLLADDGGTVPLSSCLGTKEESLALSQFRSMVHLWRAGLDEEGWAAVIESVDLTADGQSLTYGKKALTPLERELHHAQLAGIEELAVLKQATRATD